MMQPPKLLNRLYEQIHCKRKSIRTEGLYVQWIRSYTLFNGEVRRISYRRGALNGDGKRAKRRLPH